METLIKRMWSEDLSQTQGSTSPNSGSDATTSHSHQPSTTFGHHAVRICIKPLLVCHDSDLLRTPSSSQHVTHGLWTTSSCLQSLVSRIFDTDQQSASMCKK